MERKRQTPTGSWFESINEETESDEVISLVAAEDARANIEDILTKIDVPGDGSCLFWAVATAYLLPVRNNEHLFSERCERLFGVENVNKTRHVQKLLIRNNTRHYEVYEDETLVTLVVDTFRNRVIDELTKQEEVYQSVTTFNDFLYMRNEAFITDGTFSAQFQSAFPSQTHLVDLDKLKPAALNESSINALNVELDKVTDNDKVQKLKFSAYLSAIRSCKSWAGELEIRAIQSLLNCHINLVNSGTNLSLITISPSGVNIFLFITNQMHYEFGLVKPGIIIGAIQNANYKLALSLIKIGVENINYQDEVGGCTMLHYAVASDNYSENIINHLLWQSPDLNLKNKENKTALELADFLQQKRSKIAITNYMQENLSKKIMSAKQNIFVNVTIVDLRSSKVECSKIIASSHPELNELQRKAGGANAKCNSARIEECAKIIVFLCSNNDNEMRYQAFFSAVINNDIKMVEFLVKNGTNVNSINLNFEDVDYGSPLHYAAQKGYTSVVRILVVDGRAEIDVKDDLGATPAQRAVQYGQMNVVKFLVQNGAQVNCVDREGVPSLINAISAGYDHIVDYLLEKGAEVNSLDANGMSPLHHAARGGRWNAVKCLIEHEAAVNQVNKDGRTPLSTVIEKNTNWDMARYLLENGALLVGLSEGIKTEVYKRLVESVDEEYRLQRAIALGNVELLETLIKTHSLEYGRVFDIYSQFRCCNLKLNAEMRLFVENKLMGSDYYADNRMRREEESIENVKGRLQLVINCIDRLVNDFSKDNEVSDVFLYVGKFIAKNMQTLKRQLSYSYDLVPWEEMQFCLINFLLRHMEPAKVDVSVSLVLGKSRMLQHLSLFKNALKKLDVDELNSSIKAVKKREIMKSKIISSVPEFKNLYEDFEQLRDLYSLMKIEWHLKAACAVDLKMKPEIGQLAIERALQVTGECLKNTKDSPNLSQKIQDELINFAPINVKNTITTLRDVLSHVETLSERNQSKNKNNHFLKIQKNLLKFKRDITRLVYTKKIEICKLFLRRIIACKSAGEMEAIVGDVKITRPELKTDIGNSSKAENNNCQVYEKIKKYVVELRKVLQNSSSDCNNNNNYYLDQFDVIISRIERKNEELQKVHAYVLDEIGGILKLFKKVKNVRVMRRKTKLLLGDYVDFDTDSFPAISALLSTLLNEAIPTCSRETNVVMLKLHKSIQFEIRKIKAIEEFKFNLNRKSSPPAMTRPHHHQAEPLIKAIDDQLGAFLRSITNTKWRNEIEGEYRRKKEIYLAKNELIKFFNRRIDADENVFSQLLEKVNFKVSTKSESVSTMYREKDGLKIESFIQRIKDPFGQLVNALTSDLSADVSKQVKTFLKTFKSVKKNNLIFEEEKEENKRDKLVLEKYYFEKLRVLERVLGAETRGDSELLRLLRTNDELRLAVEMLMLTLTEILETLSPLETNSGYLDEINPVLVGRNLRNYLAHGDLLIHLLSIDHLKSIIFHIRVMQKNRSLTQFIFYETDHNIKSVGTKAIASISRLEKKYQENYLLLTKQQKLIQTIKDNNNYCVENIKQLLHASGLELKYRQIKSRTLLYFAAEKDNLELFKMLLNDSNNFNIYYRDKLGHSVLYHLVKFNSHSILKHLIEHYHVHPNISLKRGKSLLHLSAKFGHLELTQWLLSIGVNADDTDDVGMSPIQYAAINDHVNVVSALVKTNAALFAFGQSEKSIFQVKSLVANPHVLPLIMSGIANNNLDVSFAAVILHAACRFGYLHSVKFLLENYVDINAALDDNGQTPLTIAINYSHFKIVKFLLDNGADVNPVASATAANTPLHVAAMKDNFKVAKLLIEKGADVNASNGDRITPLHLASLAGNVNIVKLLLVEGAHQNHSLDDPSALFYAVNRNRTETFRLLLRHYPHLKAIRKTPGVNALLHVASLTGNTKILDALLERDFDINLPNVDGNTPLHLAVLNNKTETVRRLIKHGADVNIGNNVGSTSLHIASITGHVEILKLLIDSKAKFVGNHARCTPLHLSVAFGQEQTAETLICGYRNTESKEHYGLTALNLAAFSGLNRMVDILLELKADVNSTDNHNRSALHHAALNGYYLIAKKLVGKKARSDIRDAVDGSTALHLAVDKKHTHVVKLLRSADRKSIANNLRNYYGEIALHIASRNGNYAAVRLLINGENVDVKSGDGYTALHYAVINEHSHVVELLLGYGADVNIECSVEEYTSLQLSAIHGRKKIVRLLLKNGADANDKEAFFLAVANGRADVVNVLLRSGADVNASARKGESALHLAAKFGHKIIAEMLLKHGAKAEAMDERRDTPLHWAAFYGQHEMLTIFHKHRINSNVINAEDGNSPLHLAVIGKDHAKCVEYLLNFGADIRAVNKNMNTALHAAAFKGHAASVRALLNHRNAVDIVNATDKKGQTALHLLALTNNVEIAEMLIRLGEANVNIPNKNTLLPLHLAIIRGSLEMVKLLIEAGTNVNIQLADKSTALHCVVKFINPNIKYLFVNNFLNKSRTVDEGDALGLQATCNERILEQ